MSYVITQNCCKDASCVPVCPVDCIRPVSTRGDFGDSEMLFIDPETCIDCGACMQECPVDAIYYDEDLPDELSAFRDINARYFEQNPLSARHREPQEEQPPIEPGSLRVAIVGGGPAACYAAAALTRTAGVEVDVYERLPTPFGLIRAGVAPDHQHTKSVVDIFGTMFRDERVACHFNVEIGRDLSHDELAAHHHAVIYAVGAPHSRELGIPGEQLPGSHPAGDFVGWYNGHPDHAGHRFDLSGDRAIIIGNGNVALDAARVLLMPSADLAATDAAEHARDALHHSMIREVVIVGRRGPRHGAFSFGEFAALEHLPGIDVVVDADDLDAQDGDDVETTLKLELARRFAQRPTTPGNKRIVFRFNVTPSEVHGTGRAEGLTLTDAAGHRERLDARLILRSIGYRGAALPGLPFDEVSGVIPNDRGAVTDQHGAAVTGVFVTGWIKRGPRGVIGTNRSCAEETVARVWQSFHSGALAQPVGNRDGIDRLLSARGVSPISWQGWRAIDAEERRRGAAARRPRVKIIDIAEMLATAQK